MLVAKKGLDLQANTPSLQVFLVLLISVAAISLSIPSYSFHPPGLGLVALVPIFYLCQNIGVRKIIFFSTINWISVGLIVLLPDLSRFDGMMVVFGLSILSFFIGITTASLWLTRNDKSALRPFKIAFVWTGIDGAAGLMKSPFPLNYGLSLHDFLPALQVADITGIWGVTFVAILCNASIAMLFCRLNTEKFLRTVPALLTVIAACIYGELQIFRYSNLDSKQTNSYQIGTLQPLAWQGTESHETNYRPKLYSMLQQLTHETVSHGAELVVWPEDLLRDRVDGTYLEHRVMVPLFQIIPEYGGIILGSREGDPRTKGLSRKDARRNNIALFYDDKGNVRGKAGKKWLFPIYETGEQLWPSPQDYAPIWGGEYLGNIGVMICLESVLPFPSRDLVREGAQSLIVIANDIWFGDSVWVVLHSSLSILRAIENRRSFAFVNNTGGNVVVEPSGITQQVGRIWHRGTVTGTMHVIDDITFFSIWGDWFAWLSVGIAAGIFFVNNRVEWVRKELDPT